jgi:pyruvate ferredoxin oxidoreductase delta subunit
MMAKNDNEKKKNKLPHAGIVEEAGNADGYETGGWRKFRPILNEEQCTSCLLCWVMCPDSAIIVEDNKMKGFEMQHCKGCGICAVECPDKFKAITMVDEEEGEE